MSCMMAAASSAESEQEQKGGHELVQTKKGIRIQFMPWPELDDGGDEIDAESSEEVMLKAIPMIQTDWPVSHMAR